MSNAFDAAWQFVTCGRCHRRYQCRPSDDFNSCANCDDFLANRPDDGLCDGCLLDHNAEAHPAAAALPGGAAMTILLRRCHVGWLAMWWEPNRSAPYDCKWGLRPEDAVARLDLSDWPDPEDSAPLVEAA